MKSFFLRCLLPFFTLLTLIVDGQTDFTTIHYRGIRPDDWGGLKPLRNPGRGFMIEDTIDFSLVRELFKKGLDSTSNIKMESLKYASDSITLVHTTLYLPSKPNIPISDSALKWMQIYFDTLQAMGMKCVLHLTYKSIPGSAKGPKQADILIHKDQLQQLLLRNREVILETQEGLLGSWSLGKDILSDGYKAATQLMHQNTICYSLASNDDKTHLIDNWRNVPVGPEQLTNDKLPFSADYFKSNSNNIVQRPLFDYIRDHLGYRIELQQLILPVKRQDNSPIHLKLELINRGFSPIKQPCSVSFVLIDPLGTVYELPSEADPTTWQPYGPGDVNLKPVSYFVEYQGKLPLHLIPGKYKLGVWIADASTALQYDYRYDIRCANGNMGWWISRDRKYGINVLTSLTISK